MIRHIRGLAILLALSWPAEALQQFPIIGEFLSGGARIWLEKVLFEVNDKVNNNSPVAVHLLIYYDDPTAERLQRVTADEYFRNAEQFKKDYAGSCDIFTFDVAPGQRMPAQDIVMSRNGAKGGYIYARYKTPGAHRAAISTARVIKIILGPSDFTIENVKP